MEVAKGLDLSVGEIAYDAYNKPEPFMFHTRASTVGGISSALNHPFIAGDYVLMHNGHWDWFWDYAYDGEESDTETAAKLVGTYGPGILLDSDFDYSGVWIVAGKGHIRVIHRGVHVFYFQYLKQGGYFHASEPIRHMAVSHTEKALANSVYDVLSNGQHVMTNNLKAVNLPEPLYGYSTAYNDWSKYTDVGATPSSADKAKVNTSKKKKTKSKLPKYDPNKHTTRGTGTSYFSASELDEIAELEAKGVSRKDAENVVLEHIFWEAKRENKEEAYRPGAPFGTVADVTEDGEVIYRDKESGMEVSWKASSLVDGKTA